MGLSSLSPVELREDDLCHRCAEALGDVGGWAEPMLIERSVKMASLPSGPSPAKLVMNRNNCQKNLAAIGRSSPPSLRSTAPRGCRRIGRQGSDGHIVTKSSSTWRSASVACCAITAETEPRQGMSTVWPGVGNGAEKGLVGVGGAARAAGELHAVDGAKCRGDALGLELAVWRVAAQVPDDAHCVGVLICRAEHKRGVAPGRGGAVADCAQHVALLGLEPLVDARVYLVDALDG